MRKFLKKINLINCVYSVMLLVLGILLVISPDTALTTICYVMGGVIIASGVFEIVEYIFYKFEPFGLINGLFKIIFGIVILVFAKYFVSPSVFGIAVSVVILMSGLFKMQNCLDAKNIGLKYWWFYMIYSVILVAFAILYMINPFKGTKVFLIVLGVFLILDAIMSVLANIFVSGKVRRVRKKISDAVKNGENIEIN